MASELENWWAGSYARHSIRDLQALPVFARFKAQHYPYERADDATSESFKTAGPLDTFQWEDKAKKEGETFSHERVTDVWTYEHFFQEPECQVRTKSVLTPGEEFGEVIKHFATYETHEGWKLKGESRWYETYTLENGEKNGMRTGQLPAAEGQENWIEKFFEKPGQSNFERTWTRPGAEGGENKQSKGDYWWGEVWHKAGEHSEKKMWHIQGEKDWGHTHGEACGKVWDEKWEIEDEKRSEEKIIQDGDRKRGFRYVRQGKDWYKQEWDGLKVQGLDEEAEKTALARFRGTADEVGVVEYDFSLKGEHTLQLLLRDAPHFAGEVEALRQERLAYPAPDREDINSLLEAERFFGALNDKQERLKQRMIEGRHSDINLYLSLHVRLEKALTESQETLEHIANMLAKSKPDIKATAAEWREKVDAAKNGPHETYYGKAQTLLELLERIEGEKRIYMDNFEGGMDREDIGNVMDLLYQIMVKHDAVSDKIIELAPDTELKAKLDGFEDQFEDIHKKYVEEADPKKLNENLQLLLDYQPVHLYLVGRLRGYNKDEVTHELGDIKTATEETKTSPSLKNTRVKVRSGRSQRDTPFQLVDRALNRLLPFFAATIDTVRGDKATVPKLRSLTEKSMDGGEPFEIIIEKATAFADAAEAHVSPVEELERKETEVDVKLDEILRLVEENLKLTPEQQNTVKELLEKHYPAENVDLILAKEDAVKGTLSTKQASLPDELAKELDSDFERLLPFFLKTLHTVRGDKEAESRLNSVLAPAPEDADPVAQLANKLKAFADVAKAHEDPVEALDQKLTQSDQKLDEILKALNAHPELLERHYPAENADLLLTKEDAIKAEVDKGNASSKDMEADLVKLLPFFLKTLHTVRGDQEAVPKLNSVLVPAPEGSNPLPDVSRKLKIFAETAQSHETPVDTLDQKLNQSDEKLNDILKLLKIHPELLEKHYPADTADLLLAKEDAIKEGVDNAAAAAKNTGDELAKVVDEVAAASKDLGEDLTKLVPFFLKTLHTVRGDQEAVPKLNSVLAPVPEGSTPLQDVSRKLKVLAETAQSHETPVDTLDQKLNQSDEKLDGILRLLAIHPELLEKHYPADTADLLLAKEDAIKEGVDNSATTAKKMDEDLTKLVPFFLKTLHTVRGDQEAVPKLNSVLTPVPEGPNPLPDVSRKLKVLAETAQSHETPVDTLDQKLNQSDEKLDDILSLLAIHPELLQKHYPADTADLLLAKEDAIKEGVEQAVSLVSDMPNELARLLPFFIKTISTVRGQNAAIPKLEAAAEPSPTEAELFQHTADSLRTFAEVAEANVPFVDMLEEKATQSDQKLDALLEKNVAVLEGLGSDPELLSKSQSLLERHYPDENMDLQLEKEEAVDAGLDFLINAYNETTETLEETKTETTTTFQTQIDAKQAEIEYLKRMIDEKEKKLKLLGEDLVEASKFKPMFEDKDNQCAELEQQLKKCRMDMSDLDLLVKDLTGQRDALTAQVRELEEFKLKTMDLTTENQRLSELVKSYEGMLGENKGQFQDVIDRLSKAVADKDKEIDHLKGEIERLKRIIEEKDKDRRKQLMIRIISAMATTLKTERVSTFLSWKAAAEHEPDVLSSDYQLSIPEMKSTVPTDEQEWTEQEFTTYTAAEKPVLSIREELLRGNVIFKHMRINALPFEQPMPVLEFYQLMSETLLKKLDQDNEDLANKRRPCNLPEFLFETLLKQKSVKKLAQRDLSRLIPTLYNQVSSNITLALLYARLMHMFHHSPAPLEGLVLVTRYSKLFTPLVEKFAKSQTERRIRPKSEVEQAVTGGEASLEDVLDNFYEGVGPAAVYQKALLRYIQPQTGLSLQYLLSLVNWHLGKTGKSAEDFWGLVAAGADTANSASLVTGIDQLGLKVSSKLIKQAAGSEDIPKAKVLEGLKSGVFTVTRGGFLTGILEGFFHQARRNTVDLTELFQGQNSASLSKDQFTSIVHQLNPSVDGETIEKMYEFATKFSKEPVDIGGYLHVMLRTVLGRLEVQSLTVPELHLLFDVHQFEFDLETGTKVTTTTTKTTTKVTKVTRVVKKAS